MQASVVCSACKNEVVVTDHECGEVICSRCGIVIDRIESPAVQEWRAFSVDEFYRKSRTGAPTSLARYNKGLLTSIGNGKVNGLNFNRIRVWDFRIQAASDRSLKQALPELVAPVVAAFLSDRVEKLTEEAVNLVLDLDQALGPASAVRAQCLGNQR